MLGSFEDQHVGVAGPSVEAGEDELATARTGPSQKIRHLMYDLTNVF